MIKSIFKIFLLNLFFINLFCSVSAVNEETKGAIVCSTINDRIKIRHDFKESLKGIKHYQDEYKCFIVFNDQIYEEKSAQYRSINNLTEMKINEYPHFVDFSDTHWLAEQTIAIVSPSSPDHHFKQVFSDNICDCAGLVLRQFKGSKILKTFATHVTDDICDKTTNRNGRLFSNLTNAIGEFLANGDLNEVRVNFIASRNTPHLLLVYNFLKKIGISDSNMSITGLFPIKKRPVQVVLDDGTEYGVSVQYYPLSYEIYFDQHAEQDTWPFTSEFTDMLLPLYFLIDPAGKLYVGKYNLTSSCCSEEMNYLDLKKIAAKHGPHLKVGLNRRINSKFYADYMLVPNSVEKCQDFLADFQPIKTERHEAANQ